jgi:hypothetical protein
MLIPSNKSCQTFYTGVHVLGVTVPSSFLWHQYCRMHVCLCDFTNIGREDNEIYSSLVSSSWKFLPKQLFENTTILRECPTKRRCLILYSEGALFESRMGTEYSEICHGCCQSVQANDWIVSMWAYIKIGYYHFFPSSFKFTESDRPFSPFETEQKMQ